MQRLLKSLFFTLYNLKGSSALPNASSILLYHSVGENKAFFTVSPDRFARQMDILQKSGKSVIFLSELVQKIRNKEDISNNVVLTFEDGYRDTYEMVFPLLKKFQFKASFFPLIDFIGMSIETSKGAILDILTPEQIREMAASGVCEFLPHSPHYTRLDDMRYDAAIAEMEQQYKNVVSVTKEMPPKIYSYPRGRTSEELVQYLGAHGWVSAVTLKEGLVYPDTDLFRLPRNAVTSQTSLAEFRGKISCGIEAYYRFRA